MPNLGLPPRPETPTVAETIANLWRTAKRAVSVTRQHDRQHTQELLHDKFHSQGLMSNDAGLLFTVLTAMHAIGTAFSEEVRRENHLQGLLPPAHETLDLQVARCMARIESLNHAPLEQYTYLDRIKSEDEVLFYRVVMQNLKKIVSIIYTPTVGLACQEFSHIYTPGKTPGLFLSLQYKNDLDSVIANWTGPDPDICVMTDGSRILGLGDLGINGMGIPVGKLSLYVAAGGFNPQRTLPICLDLGTNTQKHLDDPFYLGTKSPRPNDEVFYDFVEAVMAALKRRWPNLLVQFEDFSSEHAFGTLEKLRDRYFMFNDDIQGTGAVILSGFINAIKLSGVPLRDHRILFVGAGSAGVGVASQIMEHFVYAGKMSPEGAKSVFYLMDSKGLITSDRKDAPRYPHHKTIFMREDMAGTQIASVLEAIEMLRPTALIGLSAVGGTFTKQCLEKMSEINARPIVFPLSNPLLNAECTFAEAVKASNGTVLFASGTAFPDEVHPVTGKVLEPGQGNNMYIFPALGLGAVLAKAPRVTDNMIYQCSVSLANQVNDEEKSHDLLYPRVSRIREISANLTRDVILAALKDGLVREPFVLDLYEAGNDDSVVDVTDSYKGERLLQWVKSLMWVPSYA
ncbi:hypothetical protein HDU83_004091 [Entophlyctis luteolus]|nr:hypothetical protein HDU83_004091 [Entophlyctis luteolus]